MSNLAKLAAATGPCPECHGTGYGGVELDIGHGHTPAIGCGSCGGTALVPRIPGLRVSCLGVHGPRNTITIGETVTYAEPGCPGYAPVSEIEALLAALRYAKEQRWAIELDDSGVLLRTYSEGRVVSEEFQAYTDEITEPSEVIFAAMVKALGVTP